MKKFLVLAIAIVLWAGQSWAVLFNFSGVDEGGEASAIMNISITDNVLNLMLDNTSPLTLLGGTGVNAPGITAFGFNLADDPGYSSLSLFAYDKATDANVQLGGTGFVGSWSLVQTEQGVTLDYIADNNTGVHAALYNPEQTTGLANLPYFTSAYFQMTFLDDIMLATTAASLGSGLEGITYVRFMNVGEDGEGSLKLVGFTDDGDTGEQDVIPEPSTIILLGAGLVGLGFWYRRKKA